MNNGGNGGLARAIRALSKQVDGIRAVLRPIAQLILTPDGDVRPRVRRLLTNPFAFVAGVVGTLVIDGIFRPTFGAVLAAGQGLIVALRYLFGSLIAAVITLGNAFVTAIAAGGGQVVAVFAQFNSAVAGVAARAGLGALPVAAILVAIETAAVIWVTYILLRSVAGYLGLGPLLTSVETAIAGVLR